MGRIVSIALVAIVVLIGAQLLGRALDSYYTQVDSRIAQLQGVETP